MKYTLTNNAIITLIFLFCATFSLSSWAEEKETLSLNESSAVTTQQTELQKYFPTRESIYVADACLTEDSICREGGVSKGTCCAGLSCVKAGDYGSICQ